MVGHHRPKGLPIWDTDRQMFLFDERESKGGHRSYKGVRVTGRFMTVEYVGNYHTFTYINAIELYVYDGEELKLAGKKEYDKCFYNRQKIREDQETMLADFLQTQTRLLKRHISCDEAKQKARALIDSSYISITDANADQMLNLAMPMLPPSNYLIY